MTENSDTASFGTTQVDTDNFFTEFLHINELKCDYCKTLWVSQVEEFPLGEKIEKIGGRRLCILCAAEDKERLFHANLAGNVWMKKVWLDQFVTYTDFFCCICKGPNLKFTVRTHPTEFFLVHTYIHFEAHRFCHPCFLREFTQRSAILQPEYCDQCIKGPRQSKPLRHEPT